MPKHVVPALVDLQAARIKALEATQARLVQQCHDLAVERDRALAQVHGMLDRRPTTTRGALPEPPPRRSFVLAEFDAVDRLPTGLRMHDLERRSET